MKVYVFLDLDAQLQVKDKQYIDQDNPMFWSDNATLILRKWMIDTEDMDSLIRMFSQLSDLGVKNTEVITLCQALKVDLAEVKKYASSVQSKPGQDPFPSR